MAGNYEPDGDAILNADRSASKRKERLHLVLDLLVVGLDIFMLVLAFVLAYRSRNVIDVFGFSLNLKPLDAYLPTIALHAVTVVVILYITRLYHMPRVTSRIDQARKVLGGVTVGVVLAFGLQALILKGSDWETDYPRTLFFYVWMFSVVLVVLGREAYRSWRVWLRQRGKDNDNLLIIGSGKVSREITQRIKDRPDLGYNIVGAVSNKVQARSHIAGISVIGVYHDIPRIIDELAIDQVIIALPDAQRGELVDLITLCQRGHVDIKVYPDMFAYMAGDLNVDELGGTPLITVRDIALRGWRLSLKRSLDVFGAFIGLVFFSPLMLITAILIRLESPGPVFHVQERMGLDGHPFPMIKFRSMRQDAESTGPGWTVEDDPRRTRTGKFIRRTNWDEMPQLINVLLGHMSLVGPRPERPVYVREFRENIPRYMERHREKAGMTGWAQVNGLRGDTSITERTAYDLWYVENWSLWLDIKIIIRTFLMIILRRDKNAY